MTSEQGSFGAIVDLSRISGLPEGIAAAEKEAKKAIYNFFVHFVARHGKYGGEYLNECKKKVDNFKYREMKVGLAPFKMVVASIVLELRGRR